MLTAAAHRSNAPLIHLRADAAHDRVGHALGATVSWQSKAAPRDIAPVRNLSLLLATVIDACLTVLVDDDICNFDVDTTYRAIDGLARSDKGLLVATDIAGTSEQDTVTKLLAAMQILEAAPQGSVVPVEELFRVQGSGTLSCGSSRLPTSAGYLAFRLPLRSVIAFPPGYNEDWIWGLLQQDANAVQVLRMGTVMHDPASLRRPTVEDVLFELTGDLVYDCASDCIDVSRSNGRGLILDSLLNCRPATPMMPAARALEVRDKARRLADGGCASGMAALDDYGLSVLRDMLATGNLEVNGEAVLHGWSRDAIVKQASFAATVGDARALMAVAGLAREGRLRWR